MRWVFFLLYLTASLSAWAQTSFLKGIRSFVLKNGVHLIVIPNHRAPVVSQMVWYRVGAMDEPQGQTGLAHFLEHLMFLNSSSRKSFSSIVKRNGGRFNASTDQDTTRYYETIGVKKLPLVMRLEAERMKRLRLHKKTFSSERQVVLEERRSRVDNSPTTRFYESLFLHGFLNHPYRNPTIGWRQDLMGLTPAKAQAFYHSYYRPGNAIVIIEGDVEPKKVLALAKTSYGVVPQRPASSSVQWFEPRHTMQTTLTLRDPLVRVPVLARWALAPSYGRPEGGNPYAFEVLANILGTESGALIKSLVLEQKIAAQVNVTYSPFQRGPSAFSILTAPIVTSDPAPDLLDKLHKALHTQLNLLLSHLSAPLVKKAIRRLQDNWELDLDSLGGLSEKIGTALSIGQTLEDVRRWPERIGAVTTKDVKSALEDLLKKEPPLLGYLLPQKKDKKTKTVSGRSPS